MTSESNTVSFKKSNAEVFIIRNMEKICIIILLIGTFISVFSGGGIDFLKTPGFIIIMVGCVLMFFFSLVIKKFHSRFAYYIHIDFMKELIQFNTYGKSTSCKFSFSEVIDIRVDKFIYFYFPNMEIKFNDLTDEILFTSINRVKEIHWGDSCSIWGPPKGFREKVKNIGSSD